jgi:hypothetical protein
MDKRCFICGAKQDANNHCTNADCPRYVATTSAEKTEATTK